MSYQQKECKFSVFRFNIFFCFSLFLFCRLLYDFWEENGKMLIPDFYLENTFENNSNAKDSLVLHVSKILWFKTSATRCRCVFLIWSRLSAQQMGQFGHSSGHGNMPQNQISLLREITVVGAVAPLCCFWKKMSNGLHADFRKSNRIGYLLAHLLNWSDFMPWSFAVNSNVPNGSIKRE